MRAAGLLGASLRIGCWRRAPSPAPGPAQTQRPGSGRGWTPWPPAALVGRGLNPPWALLSLSGFSASLSGISAAISPGLSSDRAVRRQRGVRSPPPAGWGRGLAGGVPELWVLPALPPGPCPNQPRTSPRRPPRAWGLPARGRQEQPPPNGATQPPAPLSVHAPAPSSPGRGRIPVLTPQPPGRLPPSHRAPVCGVGLRCRCRRFSSRFRLRFCIFFYFFFCTSLALPCFYSLPPPFVLFYFRRVWTGASGPGYLHWLGI